MKRLTARQREVLRLIHNYIETNGFPPTISYLCAGLGINSPRGVTAHLDALERKGFLNRTVGVARGLKLTPAARRAVDAGQPVPRQAVVITIEFDVGYGDGGPWELSDIADAVQKDYFNYAGATATAEMRGAG